MEAISSISLTSHRLFVVMVILCVVTVLLGAVLLTRASKPHRSLLGRLRRWGAGTLAVVLPTVMLLAVGGLLVNNSGHYLDTVGDLAGTLFPRSETSGNVLPLATDDELDAVPEDSWRATFTDDGGGVVETTWTGPVSGVEEQVKVVLPSGYKPDDGRTYAVIEALHGYPGRPDSMIDGLDSPDALQKAIDAGRIPRSIFVIPSLDVDDNEPDCANIQGRPAVGTWAAQEIPHMVQASFPNVTTDRNGWMIMGISAGAYCTGWTAVESNDTFGSAGILSSYDAPIEGELSSSGSRILKAYTLSNLVAAHQPEQATRFYVMGAQDDRLGSAETAWKLADVVAEPSSVTTDTPETGGHGWPLWMERFDTMLKWWGQDPSVWQAVGLDAPVTPQGDDGIAAPVEVPRVDQDEFVEESPLAPSGMIAVVSACVIALVAVVALFVCGRRLVPARAVAGVAPVGAAVSGGATPAKKRGEGEGTKGGVEAPGTVEVEARAETAGVSEKETAGGKAEASGPSWMPRFVLFAGRVALVAVVSLIVAAALGLVGNAVGGFYTTWTDLVTAL